MFMKLLFILLLIVNGAFFGYTRLAAMAPGDPASAHQALRPDRIKLLSPQQAAQIPVAAHSTSCLEWSGLPADRVSSATQALDKLQLGDRLLQPLPLANNGSFWVYIPTHGKPSESQEKWAEAKSLGFNESYIVQDSGKWHLAISLGVFKTEQAAQRYLAVVRGKGIHSALAGPYKQANSVFQIRNADDNLLAEMVNLKLKFPGSEVKAVDCATLSTR